MTLPASAEVRLRRLAPGGTYQAEVAAPDRARSPRTRPPGATRRYWSACCASWSRRTDRPAGRPAPRPRLPASCPAAPGSIAAVKRIPAGLLAVLAVLATGAATSACNVAPVAATVNGDTISVSSLNTQLDTFSTRRRRASACSRSSSPSSVSLATEGSGGTGTYSTTFAVDHPRDLGLQPAGRPVRRGPRPPRVRRRPGRRPVRLRVDAVGRHPVPRPSRTPSLGGTSSCAQANGTAPDRRPGAGGPARRRTRRRDHQPGRRDSCCWPDGADLSDAASPRATTWPTRRTSPSTASA